MCKLLIMTGITEGRVAEKFIQLMAKPMSTHNSHGIGYSAVGPDGELFSERWLNNNQFFSTKEVMTPKVAKALEAYASRLPAGALLPNYSRHGKVDFTDVRTITMHTRFATCGREFANTHPFIYNDTSLIHNGTIRNAFSTSYLTGLDVNKISTCDSEAALQTYLAQEVNLDTAKAKSWLDLLSGSWAFGILSRNEQNNRVLDVIRGSSLLYYMEIDGLGKVFTTNDDDAKAVVKEMGLKFITEPGLLKTDEMYRYDALTGEFLQSVDIKPVYKSHGSSYTKTSGSKNSNTGTSTTSTSHSNSSSRTNGNSFNPKRPGEALMAMVDALRDDPDFMSHMPDIFTDASTPKDLKIDFRKVKKHCNDTSFPLLDRLDVFDMVFNRNYVGMYEKLSTEVREFVRQTDEREGCKSARSLIESLDKKRQDNVG